jgi:hypothetical protein
MDVDNSDILSRNVEVKFIEDNLVNNKNCKILQCHFNNYTDCLKVSFGVVPTYTHIVYRINMFQTRPNVRKTITGHCHDTTFDNLIQDIILQFTQSINKTKICDDWETTFVTTDTDAKRQNIKTWEGETVEKFVEIIDDITQQVVKSIDG